MHKIPLLSTFCPQVSDAPDKREGEGENTLTVSALVVLLGSYCFIAPIVFAWSLVVLCLCSVIFWMKL